MPIDDIAMPAMAAPASVCAQSAPGRNTLTVNTKKLPMPSALASRLTAASGRWTSPTSAKPWPESTPSGKPMIAIRLKPWPQSQAGRPPPLRASQSRRTPTTEQVATNSSIANATTAITAALPRCHIGARRGEPEGVDPQRASSARPAARPRGATPSRDRDVRIEHTRPRAQRLHVAALLPRGSREAAIHAGGIDELERDLAVAGRLPPGRGIERLGGGEVPVR